MVPFHGAGCRCPPCLKRKHTMPHLPKLPTPGNLSLDASILATLAALQGGQVALSRQIQALAASVSAVNSHVEHAPSLAYYTPPVGQMAPPSPPMLVPHTTGSHPGVAQPTVPPQSSVPPMLLSAVTPTVSQPVLNTRPTQENAPPNQDDDHPENYFDQMMG